MADLQTKQQTQHVSLKYLDFVETAVIYVMVWFWGIYEFAKSCAGPLKPGVQTVEEAVRAVFGPVCDKIWHVPFDLLRFVDHKVDEYVVEAERHVPSLLKHASRHVRTVASELHRAGAAAAATAVARATYDRCEPVAEKYAVSAWGYLNRLPLTAEVAQVAVPAAAYWAERYNRVVAFGAERGYAVAGYLPLIPTAKIAKVFEKESDNGPEDSVIQAQ